MLNNKNLDLSIILSLLFFLSATSHAQEKITFKGLKFGMNAEEITSVTGGPSRHGKKAQSMGLSLGCLAAISSDWTYGGIDGWTAHCTEQFKNQPPNFDGLFKLEASVIVKGSKLSKLLGETAHAYSIDDLISIYSNVYGQFQVTDNRAESGVPGKTATAAKGEATIMIHELKAGTEDHTIAIVIISDDYLARKENWDKKKLDETLTHDSQRMESARSDF
ncbi:hypothetical protein [Marinobacter algicola]|uniref:Uncharacterized protein n=1 Tax=Marinobacter algicola DG893 TaxID=443152 RepID=A6EVY4_9GAMM|nr:hypothetical protein [Marinobacter algicola]EDM49171.1 hypothetical protein MDG893_07235 [Marinobacter algicola DG893]